MGCEGSGVGAGQSPGTVVVVGAGVSGCACAAVLSAEGVRVVLMNSALDRVCLPGHGPELLCAGGIREIAAVVGRLPERLRGAWVASLMVGEGEESFAVVDRRKLSVETKRALEGMADLELRQGLVRGVEMERNAGPGRRFGGGDLGRIVVETVFGEKVAGDAVVIAVGSSLGGSIIVGEGVVPGGRYGEPPVDDLGRALEALGVAFAEVESAVGPSYGVQAVWDEGPQGGSRGGGDGCGGVRKLRSVPWGDVRGEAGSAVNWPSEFPAAVHWWEEARPQWAWVKPGGLEAGVPVVSPDGAVTGEVYVSTLASGQEVGESGDEEAQCGARAVIDMRGFPESRPAYRVGALKAVNIAGDGRVLSGVGPGIAVWVTGRAAGSRDYVESLAAGMSAAEGVAAFLGNRDETTGHVGSCEKGRTDGSA